MWNVATRRIFWLVQRREPGGWRCWLGLASVLPAFRDRALQARRRELEVPSDAVGLGKPLPQEDADHRRLGFDRGERDSQQVLLEVLGLGTVDAIIPRQLGRPERAV